MSLSNLSQDELCKQALNVIERARRNVADCKKQHAEYRKGQMTRRDLLANAEQTLSQIKEQQSALQKQLHQLDASSKD